MIKWSAVSAVNDEQVLQSCLLGSPGIRAAEQVILQRGAPSAAAAYNDAVVKANQDVVVILHQDMYLPEGWADAFERTLNALAEVDPNWGVLGVWGVTRNGGQAGHVYCTATIRMLGGAFEGVKRVRTLDEVILAVRKSSGLRFDPAMPGFHLYGTDICLEAERRGMKCYAISAFCIHNSNAYRLLPWEFWKNYLYVRSKWKAVLPIRAPCAEVTGSYWPMIRYNLVQRANILLGRHSNNGRRIDDPRRLYRELAAGGIIKPALSRGLS